MELRTYKSSPPGWTCPACGRQLKMRCKTFKAAAKTEMAMQGFLAAFTDASISESQFSVWEQIDERHLRQVICLVAKLTYVYIHTCVQYIYIYIYIYICISVYIYIYTHTYKQHVYVIMRYMFLMVTSHEKLPACLEAPPPGNRMKPNQALNKCCEAFPC